MQKPTLIVHGFKKYDVLSDRDVVSPYKGTEEVIRRFQRFQVVRIESTDEAVDPSLLDAHGRYLPGNL
jgi:hypothetical protein